MCPQDRARANLGFPFPLDPAKIPDESAFEIVSAHRLCEKDVNKVEERTYVIETIRTTITPLPFVVSFPEVENKK